WIVNSRTTQHLCQDHNAFLSYYALASPILIYLGKGIMVLDRKSTRLNSSHSQISYAVFCLKKKKKKKKIKKIKKKKKHKKNHKQSSTNQPIPYQHHNQQRQQLDTGNSSNSMSDLLQPAPIL